jgi:hypothetical protein
MGAASGDPRPAWSCGADGQKAKLLALPDPCSRNAHAGQGVITMMTHCCQIDDARLAARAGKSHNLLLSRELEETYYRFC